VRALVVSFIYSFAGCSRRSVGSRKKRLVVSAVAGVAKNFSVESAMSARVERADEHRDEKRCRFREHLVRAVKRLEPQPP
jgi:hypothetical protein